jgi:hypothetical protein
MSKVNKVPGKPKMNVTTFQNVLPVACARIPVKLRFAKIQIADAPPSVPLGSDVPCARAGDQSQLFFPFAVNYFSLFSGEHSRGRAVGM